MEKVLVTGGAGFIGSHLCDLLIAKSFFVYCLDNLLTGKRENIKSLESNPNFKFMNVDLIKNGLDIPEVNAVIFYEPIPSAIRKIQRAGRTARLMKGKLIILLTKNTLDEIYYWSSFHKEKRMYKAIESIQKDLNNKKENKTQKSIKQKELF